MTRWAVIVAVLFAATGCDSVLGLHEFGPTPIDAVPPAPIECADLQPKPPVCADFDEDPPLVYVGGVATKWSLTGGGETAEVRHPGHTGTGALWVPITAGGTYANTYDPHLDATLVKVAFDLDIDTESAAPVESSLVKIDFEGSGHNSCYVNFVIIENAPATLRVKGACGNPDPYQDLVIPVGWVHVEFTFDITGDVTATLKINDTIGTAKFYTGALPNLHYTVQIGPDSPGLVGLVVAYDSITVTSQITP